MPARRAPRQEPPRQRIGRRARQPQAHERERRRRGRSSRGRSRLRTRPARRVPVPVAPGPQAAQVVRLGQHGFEERGEVRLAARAIAPSPARPAATASSRWSRPESGRARTAALAACIASFQRRRRSASSARARATYQCQPSKRPSSHMRSRPRPARGAARGGTVSASAAESRGDREQRPTRCRAQPVRASSSAMRELEVGVGRRARRAARAAAPAARGVGALVLERARLRGERCRARRVGRRARA